MEIIATKKLNLIPIGKIRFGWRVVRNYTFVHANELCILTETDVNITTEQYNALMKLMKKSDLLTDGRDFFTTRGNTITQIKHPSFAAILAENKELVHQLLYS